MSSTLMSCTVCGTITVKYPCQMPPSIENYMCKKCRTASVTQNLYEPCPTCGKPVRRTLARIAAGTHRYCSRACFMENTKESRIKNLMHGEKPAYLRKYFSDRLKRLWLDPEFVKKLTDARRKSPNKLELYVLSIIKRHHLPFAYNGNFELGVTIGGMIPDYVNVDGKKQVIEVFGEAFHDPNNTKLEISYKRTEKGRIEAFKALGFDPLILWEKDIRAKTEEQIGKEISEFYAREVI